MHTISIKATCMQIRGNDRPSSAWRTVHLGCLCLDDVKTKRTSLWGPLWKASAHMWNKNMESNARLAMLLRRLQEQQQLDELNDYEDDDDDEYEENGNHQHGDSEEDVGDRDVDELEEEFARAAFGDLVVGGGNNHAKNSATRSGKELEEEKLLEMLQRRLFPSASFSAEKNRSMFPASGKLARSSRRPASSSVWSPSTDDTPTAQRKPYATRKSSTQQQRQHQALGLAVDSPSISPEKINKMVHRFRLQEEKAARKLRAKREEAESKEVQTHTRRQSPWMYMHTPTCGRHP